MDPIASTIDAAKPAAENALALNESKAEEYALTHFFGTVRGEAYYAVLTGNKTVQDAVTAQNIKAVSFLEKLFLRFIEPAFYAAFKKAGLA